jgi:hypothetical protein
LQKARERDGIQKQDTWEYRVFSLTHRNTRIAVNGANRVLRKDERRVVLRQLAASSRTGGVASIQENIRPMITANLVRKAGLFRSTALFLVGDGIAA